MIIISCMKRIISLLSGLVILSSFGLAGCSSHDHDSHADPSASHSHEDGDHDHDHGHGMAVEGAEETAEAQPRLVVTNGSEVNIYDQNLAKLASFTVGKDVKLAKAGDNRHVLAISGESEIQFVDSGSWSTPHGDHFHHYVSDPKLLDAKYTVEGADHVVVNADATAVFFEENGEVMVIPNDHVGHEANEQIMFRTKGAHHGVAIPVANGRILVTQPGEGEDHYPNSVDLLEAPSTTVKSFECGHVHGVATIGPKVVFGCEKNLLVVEGENFSTIAYPNADSGRASVLVSNANHTAILANYADNQMLLIKDDKATAVTVPNPYAATATADGKFAVLSFDGQVYVVDADGKVSDPHKVIDPFVKVTTGDGANPQIKGASVDGQSVLYITDIKGRQLVRFNLETSERSTQAVDIDPAGLVVTNN